MDAQLNVQPKRIESVLARRQLSTTDHVYDSMIAPRFLRNQKRVVGLQDDTKRYTSVP